LSSETKSRDQSTRVEYSGAEELDRVLVHLREARERAAAKKTSAGRKGRRSQDPIGENLSFDKVPPIENPPEPASAPAAASDPSPSPARDRAEPASRPTSGEAPHTLQPKPSQSAPERYQPSTPAAETAAAVPPEAPAPATEGHTRAGRASPSAAMAAAMARLARAAGSPTAPPPPPLPEAEPRTTGIPTAAQHMGRGELLRAVLASLPAFRALALFSFAGNILMLAGPLFMLQVYDRVVPSGSMPTLVALTALTAAIYGIIGLLELVRSRIIVRIGVELDQRMSERVLAASLSRSLAQPGHSAHALRDLDQLRQFIAGPGPLTFFDAPWTPLYFLVIFLTHWTLGVTAALGAVLLLLIAWASEVKGRRPLAEAGKASQKSLELAETGQRNAEALTAMGMLGAFRTHWQTANRETLAWQVLAADKLSGLSSLSKTLRLLLQSLMLAVGAALAVNGTISSGSIIAATIIFGRALAPVEQAVAHWRAFFKAREAFAKLEALLREHPEPVRRTGLPAPLGHLEARGLSVAAPDNRAMILANVSFTLEPGQVIAVIGPSASGKSTLVRALVGVWPPASGEILLDGTRLDLWNADELGRHIGYLPQSVELFAGTVRANISRFEPHARDADIIAAARAAHAHDMITGLPKGYDTELGAFGAYLSAGQRQRIGLARALYRDPSLVVLDEPNANLDRTGDEALAAAIDGLRARRRTVVLVSHRVQAIGKADLLLYLERGQQRAFGPREDVLRFLQQASQPQPGRARGRSAGQDAPAVGGGQGAR
jgi:PrtD family type I secretion system ABC transporter